MCMLVCCSLNQVHCVFLSVPEIFWTSFYLNKFKYKFTDFVNVNCFILIPYKLSNIFLLIYVCDICEMLA